MLRDKKASKPLPGWLYTPPGERSEMPRFEFDCTQCGAVARAEEVRSGEAEHFHLPDCEARK